MADIKDTVGEGGVNAVHDVALVQAMLRVVKDAKQQPYFGREYDGVYEKTTKAAIENFQAEQKLLPPAGKDGKTLLAIGGPTIQKLNAMLPATHKELWIIAATKTVFLVPPDADATKGHGTVTALKDTEPVFQVKAAGVVKQIYKDLKLALTVGPKGGRRTFAEQAAIGFPNTTVGPGESNHNFGRAVDLVFRNFHWVKGDGTIVKDNPYAEQLEQQKGVKTADQIWDARDVPIKKAGLFVLSVTKKFRDRPHVQAFDQNAVNMGNALARLMNTVGTFKWANQGGDPRVYASDLGLGAGVQLRVGTAVAIWKLQSPLDPVDVAAAVNKAQIALSDARLIWAGKAVVKKDVFKPIGAADIDANDVASLKKALKKSFELADQNFLKWTP
jgi:hypothetical protein